MQVVGRSVRIVHCRISCGILEAARRLRAPLVLSLALVMAAPQGALAGVRRTCGSDASANTEEVLCAPPSGPCTASLVTLSADVEVRTGRCDFDLGGRVLRVERTFEMAARRAGRRFRVTNAADILIARRGKIKIRGDFVQPDGYILPGGIIHLESLGTIDSEGLLDVSGDSGGWISLKAADDVIMRRGSEIRANGLSSFLDEGERFADGGVFEAFAEGGSIFIDGPISLRGQNQAVGGDVDLVALEGDVELHQRVDVTGGGNDGGRVYVIAGRRITVTRSIDASSRSGGGSGGEIILEAGSGLLPAAGVGIEIGPTILKAQGSAFDESGGDGGAIEMYAFGTIRLVDTTIRADAATAFDGDGGSVYLDSCGPNPHMIEPSDGDIEVGGIISARGGSPEGAGGRVDLEAGRDLVVAATIDASGNYEGGEVSGSGGRTVRLAGVMTAESRGAAGAGGFVDFAAGVATDGDLTIARNILAAGGARNGDNDSIRLAGCRLIVEDRVKVDGRGGVDEFDGSLGGAIIDLVSRRPMQFGDRSRFLAGPGGFITAVHPPGADPVVGAGVVFDTPLVTEAGDVPDFWGCLP